MANFRFQGKYVFLTYPGWIYWDRMTEIFFEDKFGIPIQDHLLGQETGETGYKHTHIYIKGSKTFSSRKADCFDINGLHPNIQRVGKGGRVSEKDIKTIKLYISKSDPLLADYHKELEETEVHWTEGVFKCKNIAEVIQLSEKPSDVQGMITAFKNRPRIKIVCTIEIKGWQLECAEWIKGPENRRIVYWVYDKIGGGGKSEFCEWAHFNHGALVLSGVGGYRDGPTIVKNEIDRGWNMECILIDLPRGAEDTHGIYQMIEQLKDGKMTTFKYEGEALWLERKPHIIVFSNWEPLIGGLSGDRWRVYELADGRITLKDHRKIGVGKTSNSRIVQASELS